MNLSEKLEIFIPTYNRKPYIKHTLTQLTAADSPVKDCSITVLDNASEDGSSEVIADFAEEIEKKETGAIDLGFYEETREFHHQKRNGD